MSQVFRDLLRKIGSGSHTSKHLTRQEAADAMRLMLLQEATPAQIGAFLIAHRIKRPTGEELAGMLDAYDELGGKVAAIEGSPVLVLGCPYDGRSRTAPVTPMVALVLAAAGQLVLLHGGDRMPTKAGLPLVQIWQDLGVDWTTLSLAQVRTVLTDQRLGFVYQPRHFPQAAALVPYREQIGKRPPLSTLELIWCPYAGVAHIVAGFVHPPTEAMLRDALWRRGAPRFTTVKGLEGSCDLPRERTAIIGLHRPAEPHLERLHLHPHDYGYGSANPSLAALTPAAMQAALQGELTELGRSLRWTAGFYLWLCAGAPDLAAGLVLADELLQQGAVWRQLIDVQTATRQIATQPTATSPPIPPRASV